jgi:hypothetical protein
MSKQIEFKMYLELEVIVSASFFEEEKGSLEYPGCPSSIEDLQVNIVENGEDINIMPVLTQKQLKHIKGLVREEADY